MFYWKYVNCFMEITDKSGFQELKLGLRTALAADCSLFPPVPLHFSQIFSLNSLYLLLVFSLYTEQHKHRAFFKNLFSIPHLSLTSYLLATGSQLTFPRWTFFFPALSNMLFLLYSLWLHCAMLRFVFICFMWT